MTELDPSEMDDDRDLEYVRNVFISRYTLPAEIGCPSGLDTTGVRERLQKARYMDAMTLLGV